MIAIGVDVGGTKIAAAAVKRDSSRSAARVLPSPKDGGDLLERVVEAVLAVADEAGGPVVGVGVGLPSQVEFSTGYVRGSANLDLADVAAGEMLGDRLPYPVVIDNDANVAALAEQRVGAGRGQENIVMLTIGTGVGGGVVIDGAIVRGGYGRGMELGHVTVEPDGPPCQRNCPNHGCLETMVSGTAIARDAGMPAPDAVREALAGDAHCRAVLHRAGRYLGVGIAGLVNIFAPDMVVVGGGVGFADGLMYDEAEREFLERVLPSNVRTPIVAATLGNHAGVVGGGLLAWETFGGR